MDLPIFFLLIILSLISYLIYKEIRDRNSVAFQATKLYPGPKIFPIVGSILETASTDPVELIKTGRLFFKKYKTTYRNWIMGTLVLNAIKAKDVEVILSNSKNVNKSVVYKFLKPFIGTGLLTADGPKWIHRRKMLTPAFHFNILQQFFLVFMEESIKFTEQLKSECNKMDGTAVNPLMSRFALNTIIETALGIKLDETDEGDQYRSNVYEIGAQFIYRFVRPWLINDFMYRIFGNGSKIFKALEQAHEFTGKIVRQRRMTFHEKRKDFDAFQNENIYETKKRRFAMLDTLLAVEADTGEIDNEGICEEVDTFTFEGHDTTSQALIFTALMLGTHQDIQDKVLQEIHEIMGEQSFAELKINDLNSMKYLDCVIKETLRLYPPVSYIGRKLIEDIRTDKCIIPEGSEIHVLLYDLHRDEEQFPDPERFDPDRFLPENVEKRHPYSYVPFSAGSRNCVGQKFAMLEIKTLFVGILLSYKLTAITKREDIVFKADLVLRTVDPVLVKFDFR